MSEVTVEVNQRVNGWKPGDVVTVERTRLVDGMIKTGSISVVGDSAAASVDVATKDVSDAAKAEAEAAAELAAAQAELAAAQTAAKERLDQLNAELGVPKRNASRDDWAEFLAAGEYGIVTEGKSQKQLLAAWDHFTMTQTLAPVDKTGG